MTGMVRLMMLCVAVVAFAGATTMAQHPSALVSFEDTPSGNPADQEMFWEPEWSGSTVSYVVPNVGAFDRNAAFRNPNVNFATDGANALEVLWKWVDQDNPDAWVRLSTFNAPLIPNPSLDTRGKVRFDFTNFGDFSGGMVGVCIGIRETGVDVPQLDNGTTGGPIEWVGVDPTINAIIAGSNGIAETTATGDDVQVILVGSNGLVDQDVLILPGVNGTIDTTPAGDDIARFGYYLGTNGLRVPIPAVLMPVSFFASSMEFDLATGTVTVDSVPTTGAIAPFTGNGILDPADFRGTLEHIAFTNVTTDPPTSTDPGVSDVYFGLDSLQFEATVPDPVLPPTVVAPIIADDLTVTVTDLMLTVDQVNLFVNDGMILTENVVNNNDVTFTLPAAAVTDDVYTATQRDSVTTITSDESLGVTVLPEASPYSFALVIDETGGGSCTSDEWEFVGTDTLISSWAPGGQPIFSDDAVWQTVDVPLNDPSLVKASIGGNGILAPSASGFYTIDSLWFTIAAGADSNGLGAWELFVDRVELINSNGLVGDTILDMEDGVNRMKNNRGQSSTPLSSSAISTITSYDGIASHRLLWTYPTTGATEAMGVLQRVEFTCGTAALIKDTSQAIRFHILSRGLPTNPGMAVPEIVGPIVVGDQDTVRVLNISGATVQLYVNGVALGSPVVSPGTETDFAGLTLAPGDSVSATQMVGTSGVSDFAYPRAVIDTPPPPTTVGPIFPGQNTVDVTDMLAQPFATADFVAVYVDGAFAGSAAVAGPGPVTVSLTFSGPVSENQVVTSTQYINNAESTHSAPVTVGVPGPTIHHAPAQGDTTVQVIDVDSNATLVTVYVGTTGLNFSVAPSGNSANVTVSGLVQGLIVTATQAVSGNESGPSDPETVTTNISIDIICDDFEYADQTAFEAVWPTREGAAPPLINTDQNTTPGGAKSLFSSGDTGSIYIFAPDNVDPVIPTATEPVVMSVNIFDAEGVGGPTRQWVDVDGHWVVDSNNGDFFLIEMGIAGSGGFADQGDTWYAIRIIGNGGPNWVNLNQYDAPMRSVGWHTLTMMHKGEYIDVFVDGLLAAKNIFLASPSELAVARLGPAPYSGTGENAYFDDYCLQIGPVSFGVVAPQPPVPPIVQSPVEDGDLSVGLDVGVEDVTSVTVYADATPIATQPYPAGTNGLVSITTPVLVHLQSITADSTNATGTSSLSGALEVGKGNGDIRICIGIREDTTTNIEWVGAPISTNGAPQGMAISPGAGWQTLTFDPDDGQITGFTGDGIIDGTTGTLEHLAVSVNAASGDRSSGAYTMYVDNVVNVGAGEGGSDVLITGFEGFTLGDEVLFQEPTFSGSTGTHLSYPPSGSEASDDQANGGTQSAILTWFWKDTSIQRWARITTALATNLPAPAIDITKPIQMDVLLLPSGLPPCPPADVNCDGTPDAGDILVIRGFANWNVSPPGVTRADVNGDNVADAGDILVIRGFANWNVSSSPCVCP